jgi:hypothetical protein
LGQRTPQPGPTARTQKVLKPVPQRGVQTQRSSGRGRHAQCGQWMSVALLLVSVIEDGPPSGRFPS